MAISAEPLRTNGQVTRYPDAMNDVERLALELDVLADDRDAGTITEGQYQARRMALLSQASKPQRSTSVRVLVVLGIILALLVIIRIVRLNQAGL